MLGSRRFMTSVPIAVAVGVAVAVAACTVDPSQVPGAGRLAGLGSGSPGPTPATTGTPAGTGVNGSVLKESSAPSSSGSPSGSPGTGTGGSPSPSPTVAVTASPTVRPTYSAFSTEVTVNPPAATLYLAAADGNSNANYATSLQLAAQVLLSNSSKNSQVTWNSTAEDVAKVDSSGKVLAGTKAGTATIWATALDGYSAGSCVVTVKDESALDVTIQ